MPLVDSETESRMLVSPDQIQQQCAVYYEESLQETTMNKEKLSKKPVRESETSERLYYKLYSQSHEWPNKSVTEIL